MKVDLAPGRLAHWIKALEVHLRSSLSVTTLEHAVIVAETVDLAVHFLLVHGTNTP